MSRRFVVALLALTPVVVSGQTAPDWREWRYARSIDAPPVTQTTVVAVDVPVSVAMRSREGWSDLRVVDDAGREVPYLRDGGESSGPSWRPVRLIEPSVDAGGFSQVVLDAAGGDRTHNTMRLEVEREADFLTWIEIAVSDDGRSWRIVRDRAPFFDLTGQQLGATTRITYPDTLARYVRVRWLDATRRYRVMRGEVAEARAPALGLDPIDLALTPSTAPALAQRTVWVSPPDAPRVSVAAIAFETSAATFFRPVAVESSQDGRTWQWVGSGDIYRLPQPSGTRESLVVELPETWASHWRISISDRDERPIPDLKPGLRARRHRLVFQQEPGVSYRLVYGHPRAQTPEYFLARTLDRAAMASASSVPLGAEVTSADYADPRPWSERNPAVLWMAVGLAVLVLGGLALRVMRKSST